MPHYGAVAIIIGHIVTLVRQSLIRLAVVSYPPADMPARWVMVRPGDDPALRVPNVLAAKANAVACLKSVDSRSKVDVVCNKERLP